MLFLSTICLASGTICFHPQNSLTLGTTSPKVFGVKHIIKQFCVLHCLAKVLRKQALCQIVSNYCYTSKIFYRHLTALDKLLHVIDFQFSMLSLSKMPWDDFVCPLHAARIVLHDHARALFNSELTESLLSHATDLHPTDKAMYAVFVELSVTTFYSLITMSTENSP